MFKGMEYVYEVYREHSFSKAAQNLYVSQPSLSATIKRIENRIGFPIFDRSTTPIRLTECGEEYIKAVEKIMTIKGDFKNYLNDMEELKTGTLSVGGSNFFASFILPPIISAFTNLYPQVKINLVESNTASLENQLFTGQLDLVIDNYDFNFNTYSRHFLYKEHMILAVPKDFASNEKAKAYQLTREDIIAGKHLDFTMEAVPLALFENEPFLFMKSGNDSRTRADKICMKNHFTPNIILKLDQQITAYNLSCYGMGITFVSDTLIQNVRPDNQLVFYKLNFDDATRDIFFYQKQNKYVTRATKEFLRIADQLPPKIITRT